MVSCASCPISIQTRCFLRSEVIERCAHGFGDRLACVYAKKDGAPHNSFRIIVSPSAVPADAPGKPTTRTR